MYLNKSIPKKQYDICIAHLADARFYPFFKRQAFSLRDKGYKVAFVSWENKLGEGDPNWDNIDCYPIYIKSEFVKGKLFFIKYFLYLTICLLKIKSRLYQAVDPVTLWPSKIAAFYNKSNYNYFSLEYFCKTGQLNNKPIIKKIWYLLEKTSIKGAKNIGVVGDTTAHLLKNEFNVPMPLTIKNVPNKFEYKQSFNSNNSLREQLKIPTDKILIIYKGIVDSYRGLPLLFNALKNYPQFNCVIIGDGPYLKTYKKLAVKEKQDNQIHFIGSILPKDFGLYLSQGDIGYMVHEQCDYNLTITLPSRIFDYIHANLPVICSNGPELKKVVEENKIGWLIDPSNFSTLEKTLADIHKNFYNLNNLKENCIKTANAFCWENERNKYLSYIKEAL